MTRKAIYVAGYVVITLGLALAAYLVNVPAWATLTGAALALGVGVTKLIRTVQNVDEASGPKSLFDK